ncbi:hypothetical protein SUGI_0992230 [Cryptomeria japonica]|nr:hypothetical protein SUGI_0992230 [Cryptomeria japonica]
MTNILDVGASPHYLLASPFLSSCEEDNKGRNLTNTTIGIPVDHPIQQNVYLHKLDVETERLKQEPNYVGFRMIVRLALPLPRQFRAHDRLHFGDQLLSSIEASEAAETKETGTETS